MKPYLAIVRSGDRIYYLIRRRNGPRLCWLGRNPAPDVLKAALLKYGIEPPTSMRRLAEPTPAPVLRFSKSRPKTVGQYAGDSDAA